MWKWVERLKGKLAKKEKLTVTAVAPKKKVFSLAAGVDDIPDEYIVYKEYLDAAMQDPSIRNIAITGNYGIGKSSFLKWFAQGKDYLFVSLCDFTREENRKDVKETCCDIYRQLMIGCSRARKIREKNRKRWSYAAAAGVVLLAMFYLLLNNTFGCMDLAMEICRDTGLFLYRLLHWHAGDAEIELQKATIAMKCVTPYAVAALKRFKFAIDILVGGLGLAAAVMILGRLPSLLSSMKLTVKTKVQQTEAGAELELKKADYSHYVDQLKVKLIELLRQEKATYQSIIIFEDFDRFPYPVCRYLLNDLHDINRLLNYSIGATEKNPIRFIYVLKDDLFAADGAQPPKTTRSADKNLQLKLFDYILPFVPRTYQMASADLVDKWLADAEVPGDVRIEFIDRVGEYLFDYRTMRSVINEYWVIKDVYLKKREKLPGGGTLDERRILALAAYKTLMPEDYAGIREGTSIFHRFGDAILDDANIDPCVRALWDTDWLSADCLLYVGLDAVAMKRYAIKLSDDESEQINDYPRLRGWIENTYHHWRLEFIHDKPVAEKIILACPYSILCEEVKLSGRLYNLMKAVPFDRVAIIHEEQWKEDWGIRCKKLEQLIPEKCKGRDALGVAVYISALQNRDIFAAKVLPTVTPQWLVEAVPTDDYSSWLYLRDREIKTNLCYARVAAAYANAMDETAQNRLVDIINDGAARALLSLPQNHSLPIPANLQDLLINKFPFLAPSTPEPSPSTTTDPTPTPQAPSA